MISLRPCIFIVTAVFCACTALACHGAVLQNVKVEVSPGKPVSDRTPDVFGYGGNIWWIPSVFEAGVAQRIMGMQRPGMTRISLGDQILTYATSREDLQRRLDTYPLNEFLRQYAQSGGRVLFILDGVPLWVSSNKSTRTFPNPDQKIFRMSPPADFEEWSNVVEMIVRHFNGKLGLNAYYESWNEPNWYYLGTTEQYHKQYYHSVLGARRADPRVLIGGPGISEFLGVGTRGDPQGTEAEKRGMAKRFLEQQFAFRQFLDYASRTPIPELGLKKLPVDFFSWHSFYIDPTNYYRLVVPSIRSALGAAGYRTNTPLINTEWNIAAVPPYPEGNLNATEVGAAFVASSLLAMHETKVDSQIFQMYVDPGVSGYFGGTFTQSGIPRANFNAFRLFSLLKGQEVQVNASDPWVKSAAFRDGKNIYLVVATFVPTPKMATETTRIQSALQNAEFSKSIAAAELTGKQGLPEPFASKAREISRQNQKILREISEKAAVWKHGITLEIELSGMRTTNGKITHYLIDSTHSNIYRDLPKAEKFLADRRGQFQQELSEELVTRLHDNGVPKDVAEHLRTLSRRQRPAQELLAAAPPDKREVVLKTLQQLSRKASSLYSETIREIENWPSARLHEQTLTWPTSGNLKVTSEPYAVHLFVLPQ